METKDVIFGLRTKKGLSQDELAGKVMVTRQAVSRWENGETVPNTETLKLLSKEFDEKHLPDLKRFMFCGEELTHQTAQRLKERFPNAQVFNTYGPTEATVAVTQTEITDEVLENYQQ